MHRYWNWRFHKEGKLKANGSQSIVQFLCCLAIHSHDSPNMEYDWQVASVVITTCPTQRITTLGDMRNQIYSNSTVSSLYCLANVVLSNNYSIQIRANNINGLRKVGCPRNGRGRSWQPTFQKGLWTYNVRITEIIIHVVPLSTPM